MKKKWIVIPSLLVLTVIGAFVTVPMWRPFWDQQMPQPKVVVNSAMRVEAVDKLVAKLNDHYIFPDKAKQIEAVLRQRQHEGKYDGMTNGEQLAKQLTDDLRGVAHDQHMEVGFSPELLPPDDAGGPPPASQAEFDQRINVVMRLFYRHKANQRVEKVDHLSPNIGYLKVSGFPPGFLMAEKYGAAMDELADTDGLIVDLRDNRGGGPESVALLMSYFVDQRTRLNDIWDRDTGISTQHWTEDKLDGKRYGGKKPVIILAGPGTMSAGEDFAYTMQALKRATVIGEPTWGGAHPQRLAPDHGLAPSPPHSASSARGKPCQRTGRAEVREQNAIGETRLGEPVSAGGGEKTIVGEVHSDQPDSADAEIARKVDGHMGRDCCVVQARAVGAAAPPSRKNTARAPYMTSLLEG